MSSLLLETVERLVDELWTELARLGELWLQMVSWLIAENVRVLASLSAPLTLWLALLLIVAARALSPAFAHTRLRTQRRTGGTG